MDDRGGKGRHEGGAQLCMICTVAREAPGQGMSFPAGFCGRGDGPGMALRPVVGRRRAVLTGLAAPPGVAPTPRRRLGMRSGAGVTIWRSCVDLRKNIAQGGRGFWHTPCRLRATALGSRAQNFCGGSCLISAREIKEIKGKRGMAMREAQRRRTRGAPADRPRRHRSAP